MSATGSAETAFPLLYLIPLFFVAFATIWLFVAGLSGALVWNKLVRPRSSDIRVPANATLYGWQSLRVGLLTNYGNCVNGWIADRGLYLRPVWIFRAFHPMVHFGWNEITEMKITNQLFMKAYKIEIANQGPTFSLYGKLGKAALAKWTEKQGGRPE